ncbi:PAS domain S-box protein [Aliikangiella maris]|uniref:PAS domain S-box protein n=2 Tax=Aliikangiella maris TaxID=3162458 RepID=A0ABV2BWV1_9GAMM
MNNSQSISSRFSKTILSLLLTFFLGVVSITLFIELLRINSLEESELNQQAHNTLEIIELRFSAQVDAVEKTATSSLSINSLIDLSMSQSYFKFALEDLTYNTDITEAAVFNYSGELLFSTHDKTDWYSINLVNSMIAQGVRKILYLNGYFYIVSPIKYYQTVQGGIITQVDIASLVRKTINDQNLYYSLSFDDNWQLTTIPNNFNGLKVSIGVTPDSLLTHYKPQFTLAKDSTYLLSRITPWLTSITIIGMFGLIAIRLLAKRIGQKMAVPIIQLTQKVKQGDYPVSPTHTGDELEILASAFDQATFEITKANTERAEAEKRDRESQVRAIVDTVPDGIITISSKGIIETFNPAAEKIFGYDPEEVIGRNIKLLISEPYRKQHEKYIERYLQTQDSRLIGIDREIEGLRKDGTTFPMELAISEMWFAKRQLFTGIIRDISDRKETERLKGEFVSTVSHELRTPLTSIRGALGLVLANVTGKLPDSMHKMLDVAYRNSERLTLLINDILDLEKLESEQLEFEYTNIDLIPLLQRSLEDNEGFANQHQVTIKFKSSIKSIFVQADEHRLLQVMANLLSNAIKYSKDYKQVEVTADNQERFIRVSVIDHGQGIPKEFEKRMFQRFAQADSSDTREKGGTGLGLSICKAIIERHGGQINYLSKLNEGTTFYFDLPITQAPSYVEQTASSDVLICEDDEKMARFISLIVESEGATCDVANNAHNALSKLNTGQYQLLLLDLELPDLNGLTLLKQLREKPKFQALSVVVISVTPESPKHLNDKRNLNIFHWLEKPLDEEKFRRTFCRALTKMERPKVLHIESDHDIVEVASTVLSEFADIKHAATLHEAKTHLAAHHFDLILMDIELPDGSGEEFLLFSELSLPPIVLFTAHLPKRSVLEKVQLTLTKSRTSNQQLRQTIRKVLNQLNRQTKTNKQSANDDQYINNSSADS